MARRHVGNHDEVDLEWPRKARVSTEMRSNATSRADLVHMDDTLGTLFRTLRLRAGVTQQQLADMSTLSIRAIRDLETGRVSRPHNETIRLLADSLRLGTTQRNALSMAAGCTVEPRPPAVMTSSQMPLPTPMSSMIGRADELQALTTLIVQEEHRLLTVIGVAGVGKSRLTLELARTLHERNGLPVVWLPPAGSGGTAGAPWEDSSAADSAASQILRLLQHPESDLDEIGPLLDPRSVIVLDGFEDLQISSTRVVRLLHHFKELRVVVTARKPHGIPGGNLFQLAPLPVPVAGEDRVEAIANLASVRLLVRSMQQMRPEFRLTAANSADLSSLCRMLDGLPGSLELGGWWSLLHTPDQLVLQLREDPLPLLAVGKRSSCQEIDLVTVLNQTLSTLESEQRTFLRHMRSVDRDWSLSEAAQLVGGNQISITSVVHELLLRGLLRRTDGADGTDRRKTRFQVLNLVRALVSACSTPDRLRDHLPRPLPAPAAVGSAQ